MKYVVCYSGGHSSALAAVETVKAYGRENVILLNHDISSKVESKDIKRFKKEVADFLGIPITYANCEGFQERTPLSLCREKKIFRFGSGVGSSICTYYLKTLPFYEWLENNYPVVKGSISNDIKIVYGFDGNEGKRIERRKNHLSSLGYESIYPLVSMKNRPSDIRDYGIDLPETYSLSKHANCKGCLKAGIQHWYMVYCLWPEIYWEAVKTEKMINYSIHRQVTLNDLEYLYRIMRGAGIEPSDNVESSFFWSKVRKRLKIKNIFDIIGG